MQLAADIWASYRRMPLWVQFWVGLILVPVNILPIVEVLHPGGVLIATLSIGGMLPNLFWMIYERGFSRVMTLSHLVLWIPLCVILIDRALEGQPPMSLILWLVLLVDLISLCFDIPDFVKWLRGARAVA